MVEVPRIPGTPGSPDAAGKDKAKVDAEKFKKMMEVDKTDPEQQKKRKRKEEAEEEAKSKTLAGSDAKERRPIDVGKEHRPLKINKTGKPSAGTTPIAGAPIPKERAAPAFEKLPPPPKISKVGESEKGEKQRHKRPEEAPPDLAPAGQTHAARRSEIITQENKKAAAKTEERTAALPPMEEVIDEALTPHEEPFVPEPEFAPTAPQAPKKQETTPSPLLSAPAPLAAPVPLFLPSAAEVPSPSSFLHSPEILAMFEKMVGVLSVMNAQGITETTIHLDSPAFANSIFAGASVVIREFSTAPKAFNIEFQGNSQNTALFQANVADLVAAFQSGNYNFKINRIDTSLLPHDRPLFHRKDAPGEQEMGGGQGETR